MKKKNRRLPVIFIFQCHYMFQCQFPLPTTFSNGFSMPMLPFSVQDLFLKPTKFYFSMPEFKVIVLAPQNCLPKDRRCAPSLQSFKKSIFLYICIIMIIISIHLLSYFSPPVFLCFTYTLNLPCLALPFCVSQLHC